MKEFLKYTLASIVGFFISFVLVFGLMFLIAFSVTIASFSTPDVTIEDNSILHLKLTTPIKERVSDNPIDNFDFSEGRIKRDLSLKQIIDNIERAKEDEKIEGIFLDLSFIPSGFAMLEEVRDALIDFKESDKFIYAYADRYLQTPYYIASVADSIFMHPNQAEFAFNGFHIESTFLRGTLDKLDIEPMIFTAGEYKSAGESFERYQMSEENREQLTMILENRYDVFLSAIAEERGLDKDEMREWANNLDVVTQTDAKEYGFVDELMYRDELKEVLRERSNLDEEDDIRNVSMGRYDQVKGRSPRQEKGRGSDNRIAVVYGTGNIVDGEGGSDQITSRGFSSAIREAREDEDVKAIVVRLNTPGGSALASDVIWREIQLATEEKPVIASMSSTAASGGYYIAAGADKIMARSTTLTGSIGVLAMLPYMERFWENKLGITYDRIKTSDYSDVGNPNRRLDQREIDLINELVQRYYDGFIERVSEGRGMDISVVD